MTIETQRYASKSSEEQMFLFLTDMNNFEQLMPEDRISNWRSSTEECEFNIKGMAQIGLKKENTEANNLIQIVSFGKTPFPFKLDIHIQAKADGGSEVYLIFNGEVNPFMKMMVERPLTNFFSMLGEKAAKLAL